MSEGQVVILSHKGGFKSPLVPFQICRYSSMVEHLPSKQDTGVRFPLLAPYPGMAKLVDVLGLGPSI